MKEISIHPYSQQYKEIEAIISQYEEKNRAVYLAVHEETVLGFVIFNVMTGEILSIEVDENYRKKGIGKHLLQHISPHIIGPMLQVDAGEDSVDFFQACDFICDKKDERYHCYRVKATRRCC